jgi:hypothetical protein
MRRNLGVVRAALVVMGLIASLFLSGTAHAQTAPPKYAGKFTLTYPVHWGRTALQPGDYTIRIRPTGSPIIAEICKMNGEHVTFVAAGASSDQANGTNALLIREKQGQFHVHSLALADLGVVLVYDPSLARERVEEAREESKVQVSAAK